MMQQSSTSEGLLGASGWPLTWDLYSAAPPWGLILQRAHHGVFSVLLQPFTTLGLPSHMD